MRIAFLCKRRYMGKDVIDDRYGRLYEFPFQLARLGHEVHGVAVVGQGRYGPWSTGHHDGVVQHRGHRRERSVDG